MKQTVPAEVAQVMDSLKKNRMMPYYVETAGEVVPLVESLLKEGDIVASGGSMTLAQTGVMSLLRSEKYHNLDRAVPGLTPEQIREVYVKTFDADAFFCSANAITLNGELVNVDGNSNRVAALLYGPRSVIVVAGINKIVPDVAAGLERVRTVAAPKNTTRLHCDTYCAKEGHCVACGKEFAAGCASDARICCNYVVSAHQRLHDRIKVILVGKKLGF